MENTPYGGGNGNVSARCFFSVDIPVSETILVDSPLDARGKTYAATAQLGGPVFEVRAGGSINGGVIRGRSDRNGVLITGDNATIENMTILNSLRGVQVEHCNNVTLRKCSVQYSKQFGFNAEYVDTVLFEDCEGIYSQLDGLKLRAQALNITVLRGTFHHNGIDPMNAGDGIDVFAGGQHVLIDSVICNNNYGNGVTVKTDTLTRDEPETYGVVTDITLRDCICKNNTGWGAIAISGFVPDVPLLDNVTILRGQYQSNLNSGLLINANHVTVTDSDCTGNTAYGVDVDTRAINLTLDNVSGTVNTR